MGCGCGTACALACDCDCHRFTSPAAGAARAARLSEMWDRGRDMYTRSGQRPYEVLIVQARATGARRGDGPTDVINEWKILPTPKIGDLSGLVETLSADQLREMGTVMLSEISLRYSESVVNCKGEGGKAIPVGELVFYEVRYLDSHGRVTLRRRFVPSSPAFADAGRGQWSLNLVRAPWDRDAVGVLR